MHSNKAFLRKINVLLIIIISTPLLLSCQSKKIIKLEPVAFSNKQWTGLAVSDEERLFVNYPRWSENITTSVAEIIDGKPVPYPDTSMNNWVPGRNPATHFICVQALFIDDKNRLWILDPANPWFRGLIPGGPKLVQVDLATNSVVQTFQFAPEVLLATSYLNDVRIDTQRDYAYITDSGEGALVVLNLKTGEARRILDNHPSTTSEDIVLTVGGKPWVFGDVKPRVHSDGIAYDSNADYVYYQALTGRSMYRIPGSFLRRFNQPENDIETQVEKVGETGASDGLIFGSDGKIYISGIEHDAIFRATPDGNVETVIQDTLISWPDSFSFGPDGKLYFTTSRIHESPTPKGEYGIYRISFQ